MKSIKPSVEENTQILTINKEEIKSTCYIIAGKTMRHFSINECSLNTISVPEHCCEGTLLN